MLVREDKICVQPLAHGLFVAQCRTLPPEDRGKVIGKQGRIAKAIRVVMRAVASRNDEKIMVEID